MNNYKNYLDKHNLSIKDSSYREDVSKSKYTKILMNSLEVCSSDYFNNDTTELIISHKFDEIFFMGYSLLDWNCYNTSGKRLIFFINRVSVHGTVGRENITEDKLLKLIRHNYSREIERVKYSPRTIDLSFSNFSEIKDCNVPEDLLSLFFDNIVDVALDLMDLKRRLGDFKNLSKKHKLKYRMLFELTG